MNSLEQLKQFTTIVADTGDFSQLEKYKPQDSTTNPSLILAASSMAEYQHLVEEAIQYAKSNGNTFEEKLQLSLDKVAVNFGLEILKIIPGRVSTELDARLSFDTNATVEKAKKIISLYESVGISRERILVKIASTWEGLQAARILEEQGIHVNLTLLFSITQAMVAAEANATLISPFVGRITDYWKSKKNVQGFSVEEDPGVLSVRNIYNYYKTHGYKTVVMGASFRNKEQVLALAGCDLLTVSPQLLGELQSANTEVSKCLDASNTSPDPKIVLSESEYRWRMCNDECAHFKLAEGIRKFAEDLEKLEKKLEQKLKE
jgi:transaldolase